MLIIKDLLKNLKKISWQVIALELFIVFLGVYLAFVFSNYQEQQKIDKESDKLLASLKVELEYIRLRFPGMGAYQKSLNKELDSIWAAGETSAYYKWRFIQPQYDFTTLEYALETHESSIVNFELYKSLTNIYRRISQLKHTELLVTEVAARYQSVDDSFKKYPEIELQRIADNRMNFYRFIEFNKIRANTLADIGQLSNDCLAIINQKLGSKKQIELEKKLIKEGLEDFIPDEKPPKEELLKMIKTNFEKLSVQDIEEILKDYQH